MAATTKEKIVVGPASIYVAPVGTTYPDVSAAPAGAWVFVGATKGGTKIKPTIKRTEHGTDQDTAPVRVTEAERQYAVTADLAETTLENTRIALGLTAAVSTVAPGAGTGGYKGLRVEGQFDVPEYALLVRGKSPYGITWNADYRFPRVYVSAEPEEGHTKDGQKVVTTEFKTLATDTAAEYQFQNANPT